MNSPRELIGAQVIPQSDFRVGRILQKFAGFPVEAHDLRQKAIVSQAKQIAPARKKSAQATAAVFKSSLPARNTERHVARLPDDAHLLEQSNQIRVGAVVMHDETGVDRQNAATGFNLMGMGMASEASLFFEQPYFVLLAEQVCRAHSRDACSDHRDPAHRASLSESGRRMPRRSLATPSQFSIFSA